MYVGRDNRCVPTDCVETPEPALLEAPSGGELPAARGSWSIEGLLESVECEYGMRADGPPEPSGVKVIDVVLERPVSCISMLSFSSLL